MKTALSSLLMALVLALTPLSLADEVNINTATAEELAAQLKGIGLNKARAIVAYREQFGRFQSPDDLSDVKGIGLRTVDANRDSIAERVTPQLAIQS
ncbi:MAG: helix-hairpin-helix domain-containing protein, partial [Pseudomonadota bacterium]